MMMMMHKSGLPAAFKVLFLAVLSTSLSSDAFTLNPLNHRGGHHSLYNPTSHMNVNNHDSLVYLDMVAENTANAHTDTPPKKHSSPVNTQSAAANQNTFGVVSDFATGLIFSLLHAFDTCEIKDSSKKLRVLWVRALLNYRQEIDDEVAQEFLPKTTRGLVTSEWGASMLDPILKFAEWIQARTDFIDEGLNNFLSSPACMDAETRQELECNVVLFGAGYDTRALRYRHRHNEKMHFIEVDLPDVVEGKRKLYRQFQEEVDPDWDFVYDDGSNADEVKNNKVQLIPFNLNDCGGDDPTSLVQTLREQGGLKSNVPTLMVWEAVLFYVDEGAVRNIMQELFDFSKVGGNGPTAETMLCFTDSLKPFVDVPFSNEASKFFASNGMELLQHRSRWGGAVHFALAASTKSSTKPDFVDQNGGEKTETGADSDASAKAKGENGVDVDANAKRDLDLSPSSKELKNLETKSGVFKDHMKKKVGRLTNSYIPTASNNMAILEAPSFENAWYAIAFPWQVDGYKTPVDAVMNHKQKKTDSPFATRLWGEPLVVYRDSKGELVAMADVCPHRSAPLSMGKIENDELVCMYHGWRFGEKGKCVDIPTLHTVNTNGDESLKGGKKIFSRVTEANCGNHRAVVEHEGLVYIWRGNVLEADASLLPSRRKGDMETVPIDTVLDYSVDYSYIVENNLDSPHLFFLHDGSVPPIESIGMVHNNLPKLRLKSFVDDCGMGHIGTLGDDGRPKKLLRFDPPNVVRHGGVSGFEEEFHIVPIAPQRTRVLLRQHLPRGPILSTITGFPGTQVFLTTIVNNWNYHIALEDASIMQGQASRIEDWGSPRLNIGGLGDDLIVRYWKWRNKAHDNLKHKKGLDSPYFSDFSVQTSTKPGIASGTSFGDNPNLVNRVRSEARLNNTPLVTDNKQRDHSTGNDIGTWGILSDYTQNTPVARFPPINYDQYAKLLVFDQFVKNLAEEAENAAERQAAPDLTGESSVPVTQLAISLGLIAGAISFNPLSEAFAMMKLEQILNFIATVDMGVLPL